MNPERARFQPPEEPKQRLRLVEAAPEKQRDTSAEFPVLEQAKANFLHAQKVFRDAEREFAHAKVDIQAAEDELRDAKRVPEPRAAAIRTDLDRLRRMVMSEDDPEVRNLEEDLEEAEAEEDPVLRAEEIGACEVGYEEALELFQDAVRDREAAHVEYLTHKRILDHVQKQSILSFGIWGRLRKMFARPEPTAEVVPFPNVKGEEEEKKEAA